MPTVLDFAVLDFAVLDFAVLPFCRFGLCRFGLCRFGLLPWIAAVDCCRGLDCCCGLLLWIAAVDCCCGLLPWVTVDALDVCSSLPPPPLVTVPLSSFFFLLLKIKIGLVPFLSFLLRKDKRTVPKRNETSSFVPFEPFLENWNVNQIYSLLK